MRDEREIPHELGQLSDPPLNYIPTVTVLVHLVALGFLL